MEGVEEAAEGLGSGVAVRQPREKRAVAGQAEGESVHDVAGGGTGVEVEAGGEAEGGGRQSEAGQWLNNHATSSWKEDNI